MTPYTPASHPDRFGIDDTVIIAELVDEPVPNLPAVRDRAEVAIPDPIERLMDQIVDIADATWAKPWALRYRWASGLQEAIGAGDPGTFRAFIVAGLAHGFDGQVVRADEFEVALLEFDLRLAGAR